MSVDAAAAAAGYCCDTATRPTVRLDEHLEPGHGSDMSLSSLVALPLKLSECTGAPGLTPLTTVVMKNIPKEYTRDLLVELLNANGFRGQFNLVYLPIDFKKRRGLGYATVNFDSHREASRAIDVFTGFSDWKFESAKACEVAFSSSNQGLDANIEYYRNREMMHPAFPDSYKPILFMNGVRVPFPSPSQVIEIKESVLIRLIGQAVQLL
jgi:hypothetical protein